MPWFTEAPRPWHPVVVVVCRASSRGRGPGRSLQASGSGNLVVVVVVVVEKDVKTSCLQPLTIVVVGVVVVVPIYYGQQVRWGVGYQVEGYIGRVGGST